MALLCKLSLWLNRIYLTVAMVLLGVLLAASSVQIFSRYFFNVSQSWTEEVARYCFIWSSLLGAVVLTKNGGHAVVDFMVKKLRGGWKTAHRFLLCAIIFAIGVVFIHRGFGLMGITAMQKSPSLKIPLMYIYLAMPMCGIGVCLHMLCEAAELLFPKQPAEPAK
ncbi:MAG: TRAP transporter small permease [Planctomycetaceae bacterium]|nr:TRAP transporter small permease [Planctomycetaceae bacterium]